ncbi:MAG TPA: hypothetical protein VMT88_07150 [Actinomycetes bacterium]|nr:hypothetical protein [Actinomycetes bacterium]
MFGRRSTALTIALAVVSSGLALTTIAAAPASADPDAHAAMFDERPVDGMLNAADGEVRSIAQVGDHVVMGGSFTKVGPAKPGAAGEVDLSTSSFAGTFPEVDGAVSSAVPDGNGGWFIGGQFTSVGGVARTNLARVNAAGNATSWNPAVNGPVYALAATADGDLMVGGDFSTIGGQAATRLARVSTATGDVMWTADVRGSTPTTAASVRGLVVANGRIYAAGDFTKVGTTTRNRIAAFDPATGVLDSGFVSSPNSRVRTMVVQGSTLWIAGDFTSVDAQKRLRLAQIDATTGALQVAGQGFDQSVYDLELDSGSGVLYVVGAFTKTGPADGTLTTPRTRLAAIDTTGNTVLPLTLGSNSGVVYSALLDGSGSLYIGGNFTLKPEKSQPAMLARVDVSTGDVFNVVPFYAVPRSLTSPALDGGGVRVLLSTNATELFVAGDFSDYGTVNQKNLVAFDLQTGAIDRTFDPDVNGPVFTVKGDAAGDAVFIGGEFDSVNGDTLKDLAKLDIATGAAIPAFESNANAYVKDLALSPDGSRLYVGGAFDTLTSHGDQEFVYKLAAIDTTTGGVLPGFSMPLTEPTNDQSEGGVRALALTTDGTKLMVIGNFAKVMGQPRAHIAQIDVSGGSPVLTDWHTQLYDQPCGRGEIGWMRDIDVAPDGSAAYVVTAGHFYYPACDTTNAFPMAVPAGGTDVKPIWSRMIGDTQESVAATGGAVYVGGHFRYLSKEQEVAQRFQVGAMDPATGKPLSWNPNISGFRGVLVLESEPAGLFAGGDGDTAGGVPHGGVELFAAKPPGIETRISVDRPLVQEPGGAVKYTISVANTFSDRPVNVTSVTDTLLGDLATACNLPRVVSVGGKFTCHQSFDVTGVAGDLVDSTVTAVGDANGQTVTDTDLSEVAVKSFTPGFRLRVGEAPWQLPYPGGNVQTNITFMNLSYTKKFSVKSLTSPQYGNLTTACGLPRPIGKDGLITCRLDVPLTGPIGTRPSATFTAKGKFKNGAQATASGSIDIVIEPPVGGAPVSMVVGNAAALTSNDTRLFDELDADFDVTVYDDSTVMPSDLASSTVAVISSSVQDTDLGTRLRTADTPIVLGEESVGDEMGLVPTSTTPDQGVDDGKAITIQAPRSALAANQFGAPNFYTSTKSVSWLKPRTGAEVAGTLATDKAMLLSYSSGDVMSGGGNFPACRTFIPTGSAVDFSTVAWKLFDRAIAYTTFDCGRGMLWTAAGDGGHTYPGDGHQASDVGFSEAWGVAIDSSDNVYVVDTDLDSVRKIAPTGVVTTVAGTGVAGSTGDGGPATSAKLNLPSRVAVGPDGSLYIADSGNNKIRRVSPGGTISTVAGTGIAGYSGDGGQATSAKLNNPYDVTVAGNYLYIADRNNARIRKVDLTTGVISTVAGTGVSGFSGDEGPATAARIADPRSVAVDTAGNLYIADTGNQRVREVETDGTISTIAGTGLTGNNGDGGPAIEADLHVPVHVTVSPGGTLYICELNNNRVRRVQDGFIDTFAGTGEFGFTGDGSSPIESKWNRPSASALDSFGNLWVVDRDNQRIRVIDAN